MTGDGAEVQRVCWADVPGFTLAQPALLSLLIHVGVEETTTFFHAFFFLCFKCHKNTKTRVFKTLAWLWVMYFLATNKALTFKNNPLRRMLWCPPPARSPEDTAAPVSLVSKGMAAEDSPGLAYPDTPVKTAPPSASAAGEEPTVPTPSKTPGKAKQQLNVKAELEKRQGGKPLLNLVVIGMAHWHPPVSWPHLNVMFCGR